MRVTQMKITQMRATKIKIMQMRVTNMRGKLFETNENVQHKYGLYKLGYHAGG